MNGFLMAIISNKYIIPCIPLVKPSHLCVQMYQSIRANYVLTDTDLHTDNSVSGSKPSQAHYSILTPKDVNVF